MNRTIVYAIAALLMPLLPLASQAAPPGQPPASGKVKSADWVAKSNAHAQVLLRLVAKYTPEDAGELGVDGFDEQVLDLGPGVDERQKNDLLAAKKDLAGRLSAEPDPSVRQDLEIMLHSADLNIRGIDMDQKYHVPYFDVAGTVFHGVRSLLDDQIPQKRREAAVIRLRKYAGLEAGSTPLTQLAMNRTQERLEKQGLMGPIKAEVLKGLQNDSGYIAGIGDLFAKYHLTGYQEAYARFKSEMGDYENFVRTRVLSRARDDFRKPQEEYALALENLGVEYTPDSLRTMAHKAYAMYQAELERMAPLVAKEKGYTVTDYRSVIRELKKDQLTEKTILPFYNNIMKRLEEIIRREHLVSLPRRPVHIRLASPAEAAMIPAPNMHPPRLIGNTGETGEFVLPLSVPLAPGESGEQKMDDFTYAGAAWHLAAHEARPGHELQFASMVERGVSIARAVYAFNSANIEGWGVYAEDMVEPYLPLEAKFLTVQSLLMRAARAFLDPELQAGIITPQQAMHILENDVVLSHALANSEVERYTFWAPGQATSYFYGYTQLKNLRAEVEKRMGKQFDQQKFHDFILSQGLLPPALLRKALLAEFVANP